MRFFKEVWGFIWKFNSIGEFISFTIGRFLGVVIFIGCIYLLIKCAGDSSVEEGKFVNPTTPVYKASDLRYDYSEEDKQ